MGKRAIRKITQWRPLRPWESSDEMLEQAIITIYKARSVERCNLFLSVFELENTEQYVQAENLYHLLSEEARQVLYTLVVAPEEVLCAFSKKDARRPVKRQLIDFILRKFGCPQHRARAAIEEAKLFLREIENVREQK